MTSSCTQKMTKRHAVARGRFDEDRMAEIKEKVEPTKWDRGPLIARYVASSKLFKLSKQN